MTRERVRRCALSGPSYQSQGTRIDLGVRSLCAEPQEEDV
jgi:hypothetical protein